MKILELKNIFYSIKENNILKDISFELEQGNILGISGESGSGKTTLAKIISEIYQPNSGELLFNWQRSWKSKKSSPVQILFQNNGEILNPFRDIESIIEEALKIRLGKSNNIQVEKKIIFDSVNFPEKLWKRKGFQLSGGEQQRAALARLLAVEPELLILDEPFSAQDIESQINFLELFKTIDKEFNVTLICIAHNLKALRKLCDKIIILYNGEIVESGNNEKIFNSPENPYTKFLLQAENYNLTYDEFIANNKLAGKNRNV